MPHFLVIGLLVLAFAVTTAAANDTPPFKIIS